MPRKRNTEKGFENLGENGQGWKIMLLGKMAPSSIANGSHEENPGIFFYFVLLVPEKKKLLFRSSDTTKRVARKLSGKLKVTSRGHITDAAAAEGTRRELRA